MTQLAHLHIFSNKHILRTLLLLLVLCGWSIDAWGTDYTVSLANTSTTSYNDGSISLSFSGVSRNGNGFELASTGLGSAEKDKLRGTVTWDSITPGYTIKVTKVVAGFKTDVKGGVTSWGTEYGIYGRVYCDDQSQYTAKMCKNAGTQTASATIQKASGFSKTVTFTAGRNSVGGKTYLNYVTLTYSKTATPYVITLNKQSGTGGAGSINVTFNASTNLTTAISVPTRTGYTFGGYYTNTNGSGIQLIDKDGNVLASKSDASNTYTDANRKWKYANSITLYAKWTANKYDVTLNPNGGSGNNQVVQATYGADMPTTLKAGGNLVKPTKTGYSFTGFYDQTAGGTKYYNYVSLTSAHKWDKAENSTLYAHWQANTYTVSFNSHGGTAKGNATVTYDATYGAGTNWPTDPTRTGYTFKGWFTAETGGTQVTSSTKVQITADQTLHAQWTPITYMVAFERNNGAGSMANMNFTYDVAQNLTANSFTKTGYTFAGWATSPSGNVVYSDKASVINLTTTNGATITLYAKWTPITYYVAFNGNGSTSGSMSNQMFTYDVAQNLTANAFARMGYKFNGWNAAANGSGANYSNGQSVINLTSTNNGIVNLFAKWAEVTVNSVESNGAPTTVPLNFTKPESKTATVVFNVSNADGISHFNKSIEGDGWTITNWTYSANQVIVTVQYVCTATTPQGQHTATVTLTSKEAGGSNKVATVAANVDLTPSLTANPTSLDFGEYTLAKDTRKSKTVALTFDVNAINFEKTADASIAPFSATLSGDKKTLTVYFEPTEVGNWTKDLVVTVKNDQASQLSDQQTIRLTGSAKRHTATVNCTIADNYMVDAPSLNLASLWTSTADGAITYSIESFTPSSANNSGLVAAPAIVNNQLSLGQAGTLVLKLTQPQTTNYNAVNKTKTITIHKYNSIFDNVSDLEVLVDENVSSSYTLTYTKPNDAYVGAANHSAGTPELGERASFYYTLSHNVTTDVTTGSPDGSVVIAYVPNSKTATGKNQGVGIIALTQPETYKYNHATDTFRVVVSKHANSFACPWDDWTKAMNPNANTTFTLATNNTNYASTPIVINQTYGDEIARLTSNNATSKTITTYSSKGYATWYLYQAANYKYNSAEADMMITVGVSAPPVCYVLNDANTYTFSTSIHDFQGHYDDPIEISGPADKIWFTACRQVGGFDYFTVEYSADNGASWRTIVDDPGLRTSDRNYGPYSFQGLNSDERVTHIRFGAKVGATLRKWYKNIKVSRKAYLHIQDASKKNISTLSMPANKMGSTVSAKFYVDYSTCADSIKMESNNPKFVLKKTKFAADGDNYDSAKEAVTIEYHSDEVSKDTAIISVYTHYQRCVLRVTGESGKKEQTLTWQEGFNTTPITAPISLVVNESNQAVTASSGNLVVYSTEDESIIEIINEGHGFRVIGLGETTLTASEAGDDEWLPVSETRAIVTTDKTIQEISWLQTFPRRMEIGNEIDLTAKVYLRNISTGLKTFSQERTDLIIYSCANDNGVITLDGKTITIVGYGSTTIQADVAGNDDFEAAVPVTMIINVREPSTGCETPLVYYQSEADTLYKFDIDFQHLSTPRLPSDPIILDWEQGKPNKLSFQHSGEEYVAPVIGTHHYSGTILVEQRVNNSWSEVAGSRVVPTKNVWRAIENIQLDENATAIRFVREEGGTGSHYYKDIRITKLQYLRALETSIHYSEVTIGETRKDTIVLEYSDLKSDLQITKGTPSDTWLVMPDGDEIALECGEHGQLEVPIEFTPKAVGEWSNTLTITDTLSGKYVTITLTATMTKGTQTINWYPQTNIYTKSVVALNAVATSGLTVAYAITNDGGGVAEMVDGQVVMHKEGSFTITASQGGNESFEPAENVVKTFNVTKTPTMIQTSPTVAAIITGASVGELTGGVAVNTVNGNTVEGEFTVTAADVNTIGDNEITIHFTPDNGDMYSGCDGTMTLTVNPIPLTLIAPTASSITDEQKLSDSKLTGGSATDNNGGTVEGSWKWLYPETEYAATGTYYETVVFTPKYNPEKYTDFETTTSVKVTQSSYRYIGNGNWDDANHWNKKETPGSEDRVIVNGNVTISSEVAVKSLTIENGSNVSLVVNGQLTIGNGQSEERANYGDLYVKDGGRVIVSDGGDLKVKDLIIEAKLGNITKPGSSGQIAREDLMNINGDVYFKLTLEPDSTPATLGWYDFVVPFEVDVIGGISIAGAPTTQMVFNKNYAVMSYDEAQRAANGKAWNKFTGTLMPGKVYTIAIDAGAAWRTVLFKKKKGSVISSNTSLSTSYSNVGDEIDRGWNGLGNSTLQHCQLNLGSIGTSPKIQVYDHKNDNYITLDAPSYTCAIGTSFFVQVPQSAPVVSLSVVGVQNRGGRFFAPAHEDRTVEEFQLTLTMEGEETASDHLWVSASEAATGEYIIGKDLAKLGDLKNSKIARMWAKNNDMSLCDIEMPLVYGEANCELNMYAPKQATYTLAIEEAPEDADLFLTYNGKVIWNLTSSPAQIVLNQGLKTDFGLILKSHNAPEIAEGVDYTDEENHSVRKVLIDNIIYVITPDGAMYDVNGKLVR